MIHEALRILNDERWDPNVSAKQVLCQDNKSRTPLIVGCNFQELVATVPGSLTLGVGVYDTGCRTPGHVPRVCYDSLQAVLGYRFPPQFTWTCDAATCVLPLLLITMGYGAIIFALEPRLMSGDRIESQGSESSLHTFVERNV